MNILIIEDEPQAAMRLQTLVVQLLPKAKILAMLDSVKKSIEWFKENPAPDLALMDIQLADGVSFKIFERCEVTCPVIFTTAYDSYALKAFKVNSIDYILKPIDKDELKSAFEKLDRRSRVGDDAGQLLANIGEAMRMLTKKYKSRFVIKVGEHLKTVDIDSILYFFSQDKVTFCHTNDKRNTIIDYTLEDLEQIVDPHLFFRVNRKYFIHAKSIKDIIHYSNSRLRLVLHNADDNDCIVSRERVQEFKQWLNQ
jgi:DNA-binding LytR/AlgR family response regulator